MINHIYENNILTIEFSEYVSNDEWRVNFGKYQKIIQKENGIDSFCVNFNKCDKIEPLALLSLIITATDFTKTKKQIEIYLPNIDSKNKNEFLRFVVREGFIKIFLDIGTKIYIETKDNPYSKEFEQKILEIQSFTQNLEGVLLPACILDVDSKDFENTITTNRFITKLVNSINLSQYGFNDSQNKKVKNKLYQVLYETIENVKYHAYVKKSCSKLVGIYVRIRKGLLDNNLSFEQRKKIFETSKLECENTQKLINITEDVEQFIEVFVIDSGVGMVANASQKELETLKQASKSQFASLFYNTFYTGIRKTVERHNTSFGGLFMLSKILEENNDFVYAAEGNSVVGVFSNIHDGDINKYSYRFVQNNIDEENIVEGLSLIFRIEINNNNSQPHNSYYNKKEIVMREMGSKLNYMQKIIQSYAEDYRKFDFDKEFYKANLLSQMNLFLLPAENMSKDSIIYYIEDYIMRYHFKSVLTIYENRMMFFEKVKNNSFLYENLKNHTQDTVDFLTCYIMERKNLKKSCYSIITDISKELKHPNSNFVKKNLFILDVPSHEKIIYILAIEQAIRKKFSLAFEWFDKIFIMTESYDFFALLNDENTFKLQKTNEYLDEYKFAIQWLRYHDSLLFWTCLFKEQENTKIVYYLNSNIHWGNYKINQYLNFENVLQNNILKKILETSLFRLQGIYTDARVVFEATDPIVKSLAEKANITNCYNNDTLIKIKVNSVYLTGLTSSNHTIYTDDELTTDDGFLINIFSHPMRKTQSNDKVFELNSDNIEEASLLLWPNDRWAQKFVSFEKNEYYRVGETHMISTDKNLSVIHRSTESSYKCDLDDAYIMFQTQYPKVVRIGHYNYKGNHELININFNNIFDETSSIGSKVFNYILCNIFRELVNKENCAKMIAESSLEYRGILNEYIDKSGDLTENSTSFLVYPSHYYTDEVIGKIKSIIPKELGKRIISILQIKHGNNISIISPDSIDRLKTIVQSYKVKHGNIIFFDTIISSGKTREIIKNYITSQEFETIFTLNEWKNIIIIDAYKRAYLNTNTYTNNFYLRMDVPRLGNDSTCILCKALAIAEEISNKTNSSIYANRIYQWMAAWKEISVLDMSQHEYSTENEISQSPRICNFSPPIINSVGLLIYAMEVHALYARDNIILDILNTYNDELTLQDIILLICSKLLLFGGYTSTTLQISVIKKLLDALIHIKNSDQYSYLGYLTLLIQPHEIVVESMKQVLENYMQEDVHLDDMCLDTKILFAYFSASSTNLSLILPHNITEIFDNTNRIESYQFIHSIVCNDCGHLHDTELMKYLKKSLSSPKQLFNALKTICSTLDSAINKMNYIDRCEINDFYELNIEEDLYAEIRDLQEKIKILEQDSSNKSFDDIWHSPEHRALLKAIRERNEYYENIHKGLYISGDDDSVYNEFKNIILEISNDKLSRENFLCKLDRNDYSKPSVNQKIWYFWNKEIKTEVKYLLENIRNSVKPIDNHGNLGSISIKRDSVELEIVITNISKEDAKSIEIKTREKRRRNMLKNKALGVEITYSSEEIADYYKLNTIIKIPSFSSSLKSYI